MAVAAGRDMVIKKAGTVIAGVRKVSLSIDTVSIDITSADDIGFQKLMSVSAGRSISLSVEGVESDRVLYTIGIVSGTSQLLTDLSITIPTAATTNDVITGDFYMSNYKGEGDYKDAVMFSATFTSSGAWVAA